MADMINVGARTARAQIFRSRITRAFGRLINYLCAYMIAIWPMVHGAAAGGAQIVIDGRTATHLSTNGTVTDVTTTSIHGQNAYNSFRQFDVHAGNTVNLHVPSQANNLINLVRDKRSDIHGTLNTLKNGQIGGNVYLLNPNGIVVGPTGTINTGSISLQTPTHDFMDSVLSKDGTPSGPAVDRILSKTTPLSPTGRIDIQGQINALDSIHMRGGGVNISGALRAGAAGIKAMQGAVNLKGLVPAANTVHRTASGAIIIGSSGNVRVSGTADARGSSGKRGGNIDLRADGSIDVAPGAIVTVSGEGNASAGGEVYVYAGDTARLAKGALIEADGGSSGDGGFIEFSATKLVSLDGGRLSATATDGSHGVIYIDPTDVIYSADTTLAAGSATVEATNSIVVNENIVVETAVAADNLIFRAPHITLKSGAIVRTATAGPNRGDITFETKVRDGSNLVTPTDASIDITNARIEGRDIFLDAVSYHRAGFGIKTASSSIALTGATLIGRDITLRARSETESSIMGAFDPAAGPNQSVGTQIADIAQVAVGSHLGGAPLSAVVGIAEATATIDVNSGTFLQASGAVTVDADAGAKVSAPVFDVLALLDPVNSGGLTVPTINVVYASTRPTARANIASGATVQTGGALNVTADTSNDLAVINTTITDAANDVNIGVSIAETSTSATAKIAAGSTVNQTSAGDVTVAARNVADYENGTTVMALSSDANSAGLSFTWLEVKEEINAELGASLNNARSVDVLASTNIEEMSAGSDAAVGNTLLNKKVLNKIGGSAAGTALKASFLGKVAKGLNGIRGALKSSSPLELPLQLAGTVSVIDTDITVDARITAPTVITTGVKPNSSSTIGDVRVRSEVDLEGFQNFSSGEAQGTTNSNTALVFAIPVTDIKLTNRALIDAGSVVTASENIQVHAETDMPFEQQYTDIDGPGDIVEKISGDLGIRKGILSVGGFAVADEKSQGSNKTIGIAANVNLFTIETDTLARIGGVQEAGQPAPAATQVTAKKIEVTAETDVETVQAVGNVGSFLSPSGIGGSTGVGASYSGVTYDLNTLARIGDSVTATASTGVKVEALSEELLVTVGASGKASAQDDSEVGVVGAVLVNNISSTTHALVGRDSTIQVTNGTGDIEVNAKDRALNWNFTGGVVAADNIGFGASIGINTITLDTVASVQGAGLLSATRDIIVDAESGGFSHAYALAAAIGDTTQQNSDSESMSQGMSGTRSAGNGAASGNLPGSGSSSGRGGQGSVAANSGDDGATADASAGGTSSSIAEAISAATGSFGITVAADAAANILSLNAAATIEGADTVTARDVTVEASSGFGSYSGAGAFSFQSFKDPTKPKAGTIGFAGSYAHNAFERNRIEARIADVSVLTASRDLSVRAVNSQRIVSGAASGSGQAKPAQDAGLNANVAGAVTFNTFRDAETSAEILRSRINQAGSVSVSARDSSTIETGAGAASISQASSGLGIGATASANISDADTKARIVDTTIVASSAVGVEASSDRRILSLAISVAGAAGNGKGVTLGGSFAYNSIGGSVLAEVNGGSITSSGTVGITSRDTSGIITVSGEATLNGKVGVGLAVASSAILGNTTSRLTGATVTSQTLNVVAVTDRTSLAIAIGASASKDGVNLKGSVVVNLIGNDDTADGREGTIAEVDGGAVVTTTGDIEVAAAEKTNLQSYAGGFAGGKQGVGAAVAVNKADGEVTARLADAQILTPGTVRVRAVSGANDVNNTSSRTQVIGVAISLGVASNVAVGGAAVVNSLNTRTTAEVTSAARLGNASNRVGAVTVRADDRSVAGSGTVGFAKGSTSIAASLAVDLLRKRTTARLAGETYSSSDIVVDARSSQAAYGGLVSIAVAGSADLSIAAGIANQSNTTLAEIGDGATVHTTNNVHVNAEDKSDIIRFTAAAGLASVQTQKSNTKARVGTGANVTALAAGSATQVRTGALTGGIRPGDNDATSGTTTSAHDDATGVNARVGETIASNIQGQNTQDGNGSNDGAENVDATAVLGAQTAQTQGTSGLAVTANSDQRMINLGLGVQIGGAIGVGGAITVSNVQGTTVAEIGRDAQINKGPGTASANQDVVLRAHSNGLSVGTAVGLIAGSTKGVAGGADVVLLDKTTQATIGRGADVDAARDIVLNARNNDQVVSATVGISQGSTAAVAGALGVTTLRNRAEAFVEDATSAANAARLRAGDDISLDAKNRSDAYHIVGALGAGKSGIGAGISIINTQATTRAEIGDFTVTDANDDTDVLAETDANLLSVTVALGGGKVGVAGGLSVKSLKTTTIAEIGANAQINQNATDPTATAGQTVTVNAVDDSDILSVVGAGAGGAAVGVAAGLDVSTMKGNTRATIGAGANVRATQDVIVDANLAKDYEGYTITAGVGGAVGVSGAISAIKAGGSLSTTQRRAIGDDGGTDNASNEVGRLTSGSNLLADANFGNADGSTEAHSGAVAAQHSGDTSADIDPNGVVQTTGNDAVAEIGDNAVVTAGRDISVNSRNLTRVDLLTGGLGAGKAVGFGAGLSLVDLNTLSTARIGAGARVTAGGNITLSATDGDANAGESKAIAFAGAGAVFVGLGAAVADIDLHTTTRAEIGNGAVVTVTPDADPTDSVETGKLTVAASEQNKFRVEAYGATIGGVAAVGAQIADVDKKGSVTAEVVDANSAATGASLSAGTIDIGATHGGHMSGLVIGGTVGGGAAIGYINLDLHDDIDVKTRLGNHARLSARDSIIIQTRSAPRVVSQAYGGQAAIGFSVGITQAQARATIDSQVVTGTGVQISSPGSVRLLAEAGRQGNSETVEAETVTGSGALVLGYTAIAADTQITANVATTIGTNNTFTIGEEGDDQTGTLEIATNSDVAADTDGRGGAGGILAIGKVRSDSIVANTSKTTIGAGTAAAVEGAVTIVSTARESLDTRTLSGAGGIIAGASATSTNVLTSTVVTEFADNVTEKSFASGDMTVAARHLDGRVLANTDARGGYIVGKSGAYADNTVTSNVTTRIGDKVRLAASGQLLIEAANQATKVRDGDSVNTASGGVFDSAAAKSTTQFHNNVNVIIGAANVRTIDDDDKRTTNSIIVRAHSSVTGHDTARLDGGGAIAIARSRSEIYSGTSSNRDVTGVTIADNGMIWSEEGHVQIGARTDADLNTEANSKTYGLAGAAEGRSESRIFADNRVLVGAGARIYAEESLAIRSGADDRGNNDVSTVARTRVYNKTVIPMETDPKADAESNIRSTVSTESGSRLHAVRNIDLVTNEDGVRADGFGKSQDLYQQALAAIGSFFSGLFGGGPVTIEDTYSGSHRTVTTGVTLTNTEVKAGFKHHQILEIAELSTPATFTDTDGTVYTYRNYVPVLDANSKPIHSEGIEYTVSNNVSLETKLYDAIIALSAEINSFAGDVKTKAALENDLQILIARYDELIAGAPTADFGGTQLPLLDNVLVDFIHVDNVIARSGDVSIKTQRLSGSGLLEAPGDTKIDIINHSEAFLELKDLVIPEERGGRIYFNDALVDSSAKLGELNGGDATSLTLRSSANTTPEINITTTYGRRPGQDRAADLISTGDVYNPNGSVTMMTEGNLDVGGNIRSATVSLNAGKDFTKSFTFGFFHVGGLPRKQFESLAGPNENQVYSGSDTASATSGLSGFDFNTGSSIVAAEDVYISAERVNINGLIQSGIAKQTLILDSGKQNVVNQIEEAYTFYKANSATNWNAQTRPWWQCLFVVCRTPRQQIIHDYNSAGKTDAAKAIAQLIDSGGAKTLFEIVEPKNVFVAGNGTSTDVNQRVNHIERRIGAAYNVLTSNIEVDNAVAGGGRVQIFGELLSTGGGQINVLDGYAAINVVNDTSTHLVMGELGTGGSLRATETGDIASGQAGRIRLIDPRFQITDPRDPSKTTSKIIDYVRENGQVKVYDNTTLNAEGNPSNLISNLGSSRMATFTPTPTEARYGWTTGQAETEKVVTKYRKSVGQAFGGSLGAIGDSLSRDPSNISEGPTFTPQGDPLPIRTDPDGDGVFDGEAEYLTSDGGNYSFEFERVNVTSETTKTTSSRCTKRVKFLGCFRRLYTTTVTTTNGNELFYRHSVPANQTVGLGFIGYDSGSLSVSSAGGMTLSANVSNISGNTTLRATGGDIVQNNARAQVTAENLSVNASLGRIGGVDGVDALSIGQVRTNQATLWASAPGNVNLSETRGRLVFDAIHSSQGDVTMTGAGSIEQRTAIGGIIGNNITLSAGAGSIGTPGQSVLMNSGDAAGVFNATAAGNIDVTETSGDLRVNKVKAAGDAKITVVSGNLLDANSNEVRDTATEAELLQNWRDNALLDGVDAQASRDASIAAIKEKGKEDYAFYWQVRNAAGAYDPAFVFSFSAADKAEMQNQGYSDESITRLEVEKTKTFHAMNTLVGGSPEVANYDPTEVIVSRFRKNGEIVTATEPGAVEVYEATAINDAGTGYFWDEIDLRTGISRTLISNRGDTTAVIEDANFEANNLTLRVNNGQIGTTQGTIRIQRQPDGSPTLMTDAMKIAISSAERDDYTFGTDFIEIAQREDIDINVRGQIDVAAQDHIFLGAEDSDINIVNASSTARDIRIKTGGSITSAAAAGATAVSADNLILESARGNIGSAANPIIGALGGKVTARAAAGDVHLTDNNANLDVDFVLADGIASLKANFGAIVDARNDTDRNVLAGSITLNGRDGVGSAANRFDIELGSNTGTLSAFSSAGGIWLDATDLDLRIATVSAATEVDLRARNGDLANGDLTATSGPVTLTASGDIDLGNISTNGSASATAATGAITQSDGDAMTAGGAISLLARDDITIARIVTTDATTAAVSVTSTAGAIIDGGDAGIDIEANANGARATLSAVNGIGAGNPLETKLFSLAAVNTSSNSVEINENDALIVTGINQQATADTRIRTGGSLSVTGPATSAGLLSLDSGVDLTTTATLSGTQVTTNAAGRTTIGASVTASAGDASITGQGDIGISQAVTAARNVAINGSAAITVTAPLTAQTGSTSVTAGTTYSQTGDISGQTGVTTSSGDTTTVNGNVTSAAGAITMGAGNNLSLTGNATAQGRLALTATNAVDVDGKLTSTTDSLAVTAGTTYSQTGDISGQTGVTTSSGDTTTVTGNVTSAAGAVTMGAGNTLSLTGNANAQTRLSLNATNTVDVNGTLTSVTDSVSVTAGTTYSQTGDIFGQTGIATSSGADTTIDGSLASPLGGLTVASGRNIVIRGSGSAQTVTVTAAQDATLTLNPLNGVNGITIQAGRDGTVDGTLSSQAGGITVTTGNDLTQSGSATAAQALGLSAGRNATVTADLTVLGRATLSVSAGNDLAYTGTAGTFGGNIAMSAGRNAVVDGAVLSHGGRIDLTGQNNLTLSPDTLLQSSNGTIRLTANGGSAAAGVLFQDRGRGAIDAGDGRLELIAGTIILRNRIRAGDFSILATGGSQSIELGRLEVTRSLDVQANNLVIGELAHVGGPAPLQVNATGPGGGMAQFIGMNIISGPGVIFGVLASDRATIQAKTETLEFRVARIGSRAVISNSQFNVLVDNTTPAMQAAGVQLYQVRAGEPLYLLLSGRFFSTDADTIAFDRNWIVRQMLRGQPLADDSDAVFDLNGVLFDTVLDALEVEDTNHRNQVRAVVIASPDVTIVSSTLNAALDPCARNQSVNVGRLISCSQ